MHVQVFVGILGCAKVNKAENPDVWLKRVGRPGLKFQEQVLAELICLGELATRVSCAMRLADGWRQPACWLPEQVAGNIG